MAGATPPVLHHDGKTRTHSMTLEIVQEETVDPRFVSMGSPGLPSPAGVGSRLGGGVEGRITSDGSRSRRPFTFPSSK